MKAKVYLSLSLLCVLFILTAWLFFEQSRDVLSRAFAAPLPSWESHSDNMRQSSNTLTPTSQPADKFIYLPLVIRSDSPPPTSTPTPTLTPGGPTPTRKPVATPTPSTPVDGRWCFSGTTLDVANNGTLVSFGLWTRSINSVNAESALAL